MDNRTRPRENYDAEGIEGCGRVLTWGQYRERGEDVGYPGGRVLGIAEVKTLNFVVQE